MFKPPEKQHVEVVRAFYRGGEVMAVGSKLVLPWVPATELRSGGKVKFIDPPAEAKPAEDKPSTESKPADAAKKGK